MESCPLHCNQLHVFHNFAVSNQFLNIHVNYKKDLKIFYEIKYMYVFFFIVPIFFTLIKIWRKMEHKSRM